MATVKIKGGDKWERVLNEIAQKVQNKGKLQVGFLEGSTYPDGTPTALVAAVHEFGSKNVPPRPFFRNMVKKHAGEWPKLVAKLLSRKGTNYDVQKTFQTLGILIKEQLQDAIRTVAGPALHWRTVKRKGHDTKLIDTGHMLHSVDYDVK
jgi:hypothetical protein